MLYQSLVFFKIALALTICYTVIFIVIIAKFFYKIRKWDKEENNKSTFHFSNSIRHTKGD